MTNNISIQDALKQAGTLKDRITNDITRYQSDADKNKLTCSTIKSVVAVSLLCDSPEFPGAVNCQISKAMNDVYGLLSVAEKCCSLNIDTALADDPQTYANIINAEIDNLVAEREHICLCEYNYMEEQNRLESWKAF
ncbi:hypothetical protein [Klebsiella sp. S69]|uniref:hypothetical protein n=1 Tax=Klebsiella sp. S69 TaxID=2767439 RepID=UPI00190590BC|nr:hypothetical protein [Klebsiella sp. S69]MBK0167498.1 hypothetical protein [Klebsiella sp. S69]